MSDVYQKITNSPIGASIAKRLNLSVPPALDRFSNRKKAWLSGNVVLGQANGGLFAGQIAKVVGSSSANLHSLDLGGVSFSHNQLKVIETGLGALSSDTRFKAMVFDASGIATTYQLKSIYRFFHPLVRRLSNSGRMIILGLNPEECTSTSMAAAQRGLEGFIKSLAKEIGKKGATAQVIYGSSAYKDGVEGPLSFFLSPKSAYVNAQALRVTKSSLQKQASVDAKKPLAGKVALVTGASRGIGKAIAETLERDGAHVVCLDVPQALSSLEQVAANIGGSTLALDITEQSAPEAIAEYFETHYQGVDIVVHNAGITRDKTLGGMPEEYWDLLMDINICSEERINDALFEKGLINQQGRIICVSSISGIAGNLGQSNYATSKAAVIGYVEAVAKQLKRGITINAVAPGFIETQMTGAIPLMIREAGRRMNSLNQGGLPADVAETIAFFASPSAQGVNGEVLRVCGQSLLGR